MHNARVFLLCAPAEETGPRPAPKEQPPRKLSGKRTVGDEHSGKQAREFIARLTDEVILRWQGNLSGSKTEGAIVAASRGNGIALSGGTHDSRSSDSTAEHHAPRCDKARLRQDPDPSGARFRRDTRAQIRRRAPSALGAARGSAGAARSRLAAEFPRRDQSG